LGVGSVRHGSYVVIAVSPMCMLGQSPLDTRADLQKIFVTY